MKKEGKKDLLKSEWWKLKEKTRYWMFCGWDVRNKSNISSALGAHRVLLKGPRFENCPRLFFVDVLRLLFFLYRLQSVDHLFWAHSIKIRFSVSFEWRLQRSKRWHLEINLPNTIWWMVLQIQGTFSRKFSVMSSNYDHQFSGTQRISS